MDNTEYTQKAQEFIEKNNITLIDTDPTEKYVSSLNQIINECNNLFENRTKRFLKPIKDSAPEFTAMPKIHKEGIPIRPLINYTTAPTYKIAKYLTNFIKDNIILKNNHSIKNNIEFVAKIKQN